MSDGVKETITPFFRPRAEPLKPDLPTQYGEMAAALRDGSSNASRFLGLLRQVLAPYAETNGELVLNVNGSRSYFSIEGKPYTNFAAILLSVVRTHSIDHVQHDLEVLIWGQHLREKIILVEERKFRSGAWLHDLGPQYICERGIRNIQILLQAMSQYAPVTDKYLYDGWVGSHDTYIVKGQRVTGEDWSADAAQAPCRHALDMLDVAPHSLTIPLLSIALLSLVQSRMMIQGEYFKGVCCIVAPTQSFKTTLASLFFDFQDGRKANINFEATMAAIVRTVGNTRDSTTIVDDFKPGATKMERNDMIHKLSTIIRMCSDDSGGVQKAGAQNSTFSNASHGLVVVTAEHIQLQVQSTLARLLILEMNRQDVDVGKLTYFQDHHQEYRDFIQGFTKHIASQGVDKFCEHLAQRFLQERNTLRKKLAADTPVDNRASDMCVWLWIAFREFLNYAKLVGVLSPEQFDNYAVEAHTVFLSLMAQQAERVSELNPIAQFFRGLATLLDTREAHIGELQLRNSGYAVADSKEALGFAKKGCIYLKNGTAFQAVASHYRRLGREFTVSESVLRKALADGGHILPKGKGYIHRLSVNHESYQCVKFEKSTFDALRKGGKQDGAGFDEELRSDWALQQDADSFLGPSS